MRTAELAALAGVNLQTLRFYEREGLLQPPQRTAAGYRSYTQADLERMLFIRKNQRLGFTLEEIRDIISLHDALVSMQDQRFSRRPPELDALIAIGRERLLILNEKWRQLGTMRRQMQAMLRQLESARSVRCPQAAGGSARRLSS